MINPVFKKTAVNQSLTDQRSTDILEGQETLLIEARALNEMADALDQTFSDVVDLFANIKGRIIVTGMGKSGQIGRKIASTFASTGTPSFFVHPSEASHGDLGMIAQNDSVLLLSNSGESAELKDTIAFCKRFGIPMVAITSNRKSTLGRQSDYVLELIKAREACPTGKAPTTSTTLTVALGDALAVALMKRHGFTASDFSVFHPGGKLGQKLLKVSDIMRSNQELPLVPMNGVMQDALDSMSASNFGRAIVVDDNGDLLGFVSDGDLRRHMAPDLPSRPVTEIMSKNPKRIDQKDMAAKALAIMNEYEITDLVVTDGDKPIGLLRMHDILKAGVA